MMYPLHVVGILCVLRWLLFLWNSCICLMDPMLKCSWRRSVVFELAACSMFVSFLSLHIRILLRCSGVIVCRCGVIGLLCLPCDSNCKRLLFLACMMYRCDFPVVCAIADTFYQQCASVTRFFGILLCGTMCLPPRTRTFLWSA